MSVSLRKSVVVYTLSNLFSTALPFILLPFLTHYLDKDDYGILSNFTGLLALMMPLVGINFVSAYSRQYYKKEVDIPSYIGSGISIQFLLAIIFSLFLFIFEEFITAKTGIGSLYVRMIGAYCFIFGLSEILLTKWRLDEKVWHFSVFKIVRTMLEIALTFVFILGYGMNYEGRILGILLSTLIFVIPVVWLMAKNGSLKISWNKDHVKHALKYGAPLIPHALGGTILSFSDKMVITNELGLEANGVYSVAFQVALIIGLFQNSFNQAWVPWFFKTLTDVTEAMKARIVRVTYLYYLGLAAMTVLLIVCTPIIFQVLGKEFKAGSGLVFWIAIGFLFNGMYKMVVNYLFYMEKTMLIGTITVVTAIINIALNLVLIPKMGLNGAAIATATTFFIQFVTVWIFAQRQFPMPWIHFKKS